MNKENIIDTFRCIPKEDLHRSHQTSNEIKNSMYVSLLSWSQFFLLSLMYELKFYT